MRIAIMAAGGVGGYLGAKLVRTGHDVAMVARGRHLDVIRSEGLTVETLDETFTVQPAIATDDPHEIGQVDIVVFAVKLPDTEKAAEAARPLVGPATLVVPFQNGVESTARISQVLGKEHAGAGVAYIAISIAAAGRLRKVGELERFLFAEADGRQSERIQALRSAMSEAGMNAPEPADIDVERWRKFTFLAALSGMTAASRSPIGVIRGDDAMREVFRQAMAEVAAVAKATGVAVPEDLVEQHMRFIEGLSPEMTASQAHDLAAGKPLELEGLSGAVVRLGAEVGVATPVHATFRAVLRPYLAGSPAH